MEKSVVAFHTFPSQLTYFTHLISKLFKNVNSAEKKKKEKQEKQF